MSLRDVSSDAVINTKMKIHMYVAENYNMKTWLNLGYRFVYDE